LEEGVLEPSQPQQKTLSFYLDFATFTIRRVKLILIKTNENKQAGHEIKTTAKLGTKGGIERVDKFSFFELWLNFSPDVSIRNSAGIISS
jgi:hypothetical protein